MHRLAGCACTPARPPCPRSRSMTLQTTRRIPRTPCDALDRRGLVCKKLLASYKLHSKLEKGTLAAEKLTE